MMGQSTAAALGGKGGRRARRAVRRGWGAALTPSLSTVSHSYGYGLLDAGAMVSLAKNWTTVGPQRKCVIDVLMEPK